MVVLFSLLIVCLSVSFFHQASTLQAETTGEGQLVYIIPVEKEVEKGLYAFLQRATEEAEAAGANQIIFEINSPGGFTDAANNIGQLIDNLDIPTTSYVVREALSAGSYIALHTDEIYMNPNATMGASGIITSDGNAADKKAQSAWIAAMRGVAESKGRDPLYAVAMADDSIDLPELDAGVGSYLTLTANRALEVGYAEGIVNNRVELLHKLQLSDATVVEVELSFAEKVARFITHPVVIPILLSIATLGLVVELYSPGFGVPGIMGIGALILFFYGHIIAGFAGMESILLLVAGIILIVIEFFVPGGILGALGAGAIIGSLLMAGYSVPHMLISVAIAILVAIVAAVFLYRRLGAGKGIFSKIILSDRTTTDLGYVTIDDRQHLIGLEGVALTPLRPAGTVLVGDERIDVVSEGDFIAKDESIRIVFVEGMRVVVRKI